MTVRGSNISDVRPFEPLDAVRCAVTGEIGLSNLAVTMTGLCRPRSFRGSLFGLSRRRIRSGDGASAWALSDDAGVHGLAFVRPRSGAKSWELSHLYAASPSDTSVIRLLERAAAAAALHGGERVFLRVEADSQVIPTARQAGFFPCFREVLFRGTGARDESGHSLLDAEGRLRMRRSADDYDLFRLYTAATPLKVRQLAAMTFDQWSASRERAPGRQSERVLEVDGRIKASLGTSRRFGGASLSLTVHPDCLGLTGDIVDAGLRWVSRAGTVLTLVEEHAPHLAGVLERRGLETSGDFLMLVKSTARTVRERAPARSSLAAVE